MFTKKLRSTSIYIQTKPQLEKSISSDPCQGSLSTFFFCTIYDPKESFTYSIGIFLEFVLPEPQYISPSGLTICTIQQTSRQLKCYFIRSSPTTPTVAFYGDLLWCLHNYSGRKLTRLGRSVDWSLFMSLAVTLQPSNVSDFIFFSVFKWRSPALVIREFETFKETNSVKPAFTSIWENKLR